VKKAEHQRIDAFELWCWRRLLRVPWTARRSNQSILKEISPGISLEGVMLKLKLQYFGQLTRRTDSLEKTLMLGVIGGRRRRGRQRMRWLDGINDSMDVSLSELREFVIQGGLACCDSWGRKESDTIEPLIWSYLIWFFGTLHSVGYIFPFLPCLLLFFFPQLWKASSDNYFAFLHFFFFGLAFVTGSYTMLWISGHSSSDTLSTRFNPLNLSPPLYKHKGFDLSHTQMLFTSLVLLFSI